MSPRKLISLTTLVALSAVVGLAASMFGEGKQASPSPELPPQEPVARPPVAEPLRVVATDVLPKATRSTRTVRDYLQEYYGAEWEAKRLVLEKTQASLLDQLIDDQVPILPWEDVAEQVRSEFLMTPAAMESQAQEFMMWDPDTDLSWENVRRIYPYAPEALGEQHLLEFRAIAKQHNEPLREAALQRSAMLADALAFKWATNDIVKGPFTFVAGCKPVGRRSVMATTCCSKTGWAVAASVYSDELPPEYEAVANSVTKMAAERDKALGTYIKSLQ